MLNKQDTYLALARIAKSRLVNTNAEDMTMVALAFWHEGFVPDEYRDELAIEWGLEQDITPHFEYIYIITKLVTIFIISDYKRPSGNFVL